jgi:hypothetical protein
MFEQAFKNIDDVLRRRSRPAASAWDRMGSTFR